MARADVLELAQLIAGDQGDTPHLSRFYDEVLIELGAKTDTLSAFMFTDVGTTGGVRHIPEQAQRLLAVYYDTRELSLASINQVTGYFGALWRSRDGTPFSYVLDEHDPRTFTVVPTPRNPPQPFIPAWFSPFGHDYPEDNVAILATENREDVPRYLDLWLALSIVSREFRRETRHKDTQFADACEALASVIGGWVL